MNNEVCPDCGGLIRIRNPTGKCDHLYYPEYKPKKIEKEQADILREIVKWMDNQPEVWFDDKTINQIIEMYEKDKENNLIGLEAQK